MAGGGIQGGRIVGSTNRLGESPADRPLEPCDLHATMYHVLGIDPETRFLDHAGRTRRRRLTGRSDSGSCCSNQNARGCDTGLQSKSRKTFLRLAMCSPTGDFVRGCDVQPSKANAAIQIRIAIANLGGVEPGYVHALDTFDDELAHFDFWGSLDTVEVALELERQLGINIADDKLQRIVNPELVSGWTVADFVRNVIEVTSPSCDS